MKIKNLILFLVIIIRIIQTYGQEIKVSEGLTLIKLTEHTYIHTCENNNGIVHVNNGEAIIVSTPDSDVETKNLIDWTKESLQAKIVGYVIDRWHPDAMEGLDIVQKMGINTYSYELTRKIAKARGLPVPEIGFDPKIELDVGGDKIICHYLGAAHTDDGIVVWIPKEEILFGGNEIRSYNGWVGNIGDANLDEWSKTIEKVKNEYGPARIVIPGHGRYGGAELIDYTIDLYKANKWGVILRKHNIKRLPVFNDYDDFFEVAQLDSTNGDIRYLFEATVFVNDSNRYLKIESPLIQHNVKNKRIDSDYGRLQIFDKLTETHKPITDVYYKGLIIFKEDDEVGYRIILKEMIR
jgi:glyoxylase-like metal-dependent hydrolase (beta-lactamase superfamily II)